MRFCLVSEAGVPEETVRLLREACGARAIPFEEVLAKKFDFDPVRQLRPGDLLYKAAVSMAATRVEQFLFTPGVATFHAGEDALFFTADNQALIAQRAGVPMPRFVYVASSAVDLLRRGVERVGGFPVVVKVLGRSNGVGVMLAESLASLRSLVDFTLAQGQNPMLCEFIAQAVHWRVVVLGGRALAHYRNRQGEDDFRSVGGKAPEDFAAVPPPAVVEAAVKAAAALRLEFAGVDILEGPSRRVFFLEANFPFYFPHAQLHGGVDIAGAMVDFLAAKVSDDARAR
jgi:hypothetical protein